MRWLLFLSRVALVCNIAFLLSMLLQWRGGIPDQGVQSTIFIAGVVLAPFVFSPVFALMYAIAVVLKKPLRVLVPKWLVIANFSFLVVQIVFVLFFLHDPFHYKR